jgi:hypothetical protein
LTSEAVLIQIELTGTKPLVWRSFVVPVQINLHQFHLGIQAVMGWQALRIAVERDWTIGLMTA